MLSPDTVLVFLGASVALALVPGPDNLFVLTQSALHGRLAGLLVTLGLCTGILGHTVAVTLGVAALIATSALAFTLLKLIGAAYLVYLAWQAFRASTQRLASTGQPALSALQLYRRGVIMNITNPKVAIFFLAFLPQFASPANGSVTLQLVALGALFVVTTLLVFGSVAWCAGYLGHWLRRSPGAQVLMNRLAGLVFLALAARLGFARQ